MISKNIRLKTYYLMAVFVCTLPEYRNKVVSF